MSSFATAGAVLLVAIFSQFASIDAGQCFINSGYDYSPNLNDMMDQIVNDLGACCDLCTTKPGCTAFVWHPSNSKCYLKNGYGKPAVSPTLFFGFPDNTTKPVPGSCPSGGFGCSSCCSSGTCAPGWKGPTTSQKCYQVPAQVGNPITGDQICGVTPGAHLGSIKSQDESNFVNSNLLQEADGDWLVTSGRWNGNSWYWADSSAGSPLMYNNFGIPASQTANPSSSNVYLYLYPSGGANTGKFFGDQSVNHRLLCEISLREQNGCGKC